MKVKISCSKIHVVLSELCKEEVTLAPYAVKELPKTTFLEGQMIFTLFKCRYDFVCGSSI